MIRKNRLKSPVLPSSSSEQAQRRRAIQRLSLKWLFSLLCVVSTGFMTGCTSLPSMDRFPSLAIQQPRESKEEIVKLQIFLDSKQFRPGVVDGHSGEYTRKALTLYRHAHNLPTNWQPNLEGITPYRSYTITAKDLNSFGPMASEPADMAKLSRLPYEHLVELVAERFHTTQDFIAELNPGINVNALRAGDQIVVPNISSPFRIHDYPGGYPAGPKNRQVIVDVHYRMLQVQEGSRIIAVFPITPGSEQHPAPKGEWKITRLVPNPWFRWDEGVLKRGERTSTFFNLPPGPNSPVGILWAGLSRPGIGIHGSPNPDTIGRAGSHGCIRLSNWDAATFRTLVNNGTKVSIW